MCKSLLPLYFSELSQAVCPWPAPLYFAAFVGCCIFQTYTKTRFRHGIHHVRHLRVRKYNAFAGMWENARHASTAGVLENIHLKQSIKIEKREVNTVSHRQRDFAVLRAYSLSRIFLFWLINVFNQLLLRICELDFFSVLVVKFGHFREWCVIDGENLSKRLNT